MKNIYTMAAGFLLCAGLASCEMKEELFGKGEVPSETGKVELGVAVNDKTNVVITKADATAGDDSQGSNVDPAEYPVIFTHQSADYTQEYVYEDIEGTEVTLPIGEYLVESHTPGELEKQMTYPYYGGEAKLTVTKDVTSEASVVCTMQNSRIVMTYGETFSTKFTEWTVTIDDGSDMTLTFTQEMGINPDAVYWHFNEDCAKITINVTAKNAAGEDIFESRTITKPSGTGNNYWTGGDALTITMEPGPDEENPENPSGVSGITIKVEAFFPESTDKDDTVWVDIDGEETTDPEEPEEPENPGGGEEEPEDPDTGSLSMTMPNNGAISYTHGGTDAPATANVEINAPEGIKSLKVWIECGNDGFARTISDLEEQHGLDFITSGVEVVGNPTMGVILGENASVPNLGDTSYNFPIQPFFKLMDIYGATAPDAHVFRIILEDNAGNKIEDELSVTINPAN